MDPYTPRTRIGGFILTWAVNGMIGGRTSLANMLRVLRRDEGVQAALQCRNWLIWLGAYPVKN